MKKFFLMLAISMLMLCLFTVSVFASEYTVQSEAELNSAFEAINKSEENATINMGGDLTGSSGFLKFTSDKAKTITINITGDTKIDDSIIALNTVHIIVNLNGFTYTSTRNSGDFVGSAFATDSNNAKITVNGASENGSFGKIISSDVTYYVKHGTCEHFNADIQTKSEECFYTGSKDGICVISVDGGVITNDSSVVLAFNNISKGSYFKNCEFVSTNKSNSYDSYASDKGWELLFENVKFNGNKFESSTGKCAMVVKDPVDGFAEADITLGSDSGGNQKLYIIKSPTCQAVGSQFFKQKDGETSTTELDKIPHKLDGEIIDIEYVNGFSSLGKYKHECTMCSEAYLLDTATVPAIFTVKGYSLSPDETGIATGITINKKALEEYESMKQTKLTFGYVVFNPKYLGEESIFNGEVVNASKGSLQLKVSTEYANTSVIVSGFNSTNDGIELVFAGYAYEGDDASNIDVMQKEYAENEANPMTSKVTRGEKTLYTVKVTTVVEPRLTLKKESLDEYVKP